MDTTVFENGNEIAEEMFDIVGEARRKGRLIIDDPYPVWAEHREQAPVWRGHAVELLGDSPPAGRFMREREHFTLLSFEHCQAALLDNQLFSSEIYGEYFPAMQLGRSILHMGGAEHRRYRNIVQTQFTKARATDWWTRSWIEDIVAELVEVLSKHRSVDLSKTLCARLPMHTITRAFGMDDTIAIKFRRALLTNMEPEASAEQREAADDFIIQTLRQEVANRQTAPRDDLISMLLHSEFRDEDGEIARLSEEEIFGFCRVVLTAGGGTTFRQLGITLVALLSDPAQLDAVRADRTQIEKALHESLRWNTTLPIFHRLVTRDTELAGVSIPAGSVVDICLGAGNRDPKRWENPERYDLFRPVQRHLGFAGGAHTCLGMFVAQAEMTVAINALLDNFPNIRFDPDCERPRISGSPELRGVSHLTVRLD